MIKKKKCPVLTSFLLVSTLLELAVILYLLLPMGHERAEASLPDKAVEPAAVEQLAFRLQPEDAQLLKEEEAPAAAPEDAPEKITVKEKEKPAGEPSASEILARAQLVAHGMGSIGELITPNCLEGFLAQYKAGIRVFEADFRLTRDGEVVLRHDWWHADWQNGIDWTHIPTREKFISEPILSQYTPLSFRDLLLLMEVYPDICIITDTKFDESDIFTLQFDAMLADARELGLTYLFDRIAIQVYNGNMRTALNNLYPFPHYIYTLYQDSFKGTKDAFREKVVYCAERGIGGITMDEYWWNASFAAIAKEYDVQVYVHTVNDAAKAKELLNTGVSGVYSDTLTPGDLE